MIPLEDINVSKDIVFCRQCSNTFSFAELTSDQTALDVDVSQPPGGAWVKNQGLDSEVGATTRSWVALILVPFALVWSGGSLGGIYGTQIAKGQFELGQSLFGIPFLIGSLVLVPIALMTIFGKVVVRRSGDQGSVFIGFGLIGWTRRFRWSEIRAVRSTLSTWQQNGRNMPLIELQGSKPIRFGSQLSENRRNFMIAVLKRQMLGGR